MKLYTRTGDDGTTRLFGNRTVGKDDRRVEAYGCVDELNSAIGLTLAACKHDELTTVLTAVQRELFTVGADLSTPADADAAVTRISPDHAAALERHIDTISEPLPPLKYFILPGGSEPASRLHVARCVCRRAERAAVALSRHAAGVEHIIIYLNRLSDLLFALARRANQLEGVEDVNWQSNDTD